MYRSLPPKTAAKSKVIYKKNPPTLVGGLFLVQIENSEIEVSREGDPEKIRNLQIGRERWDGAIGEDGFYYKKQKQQKPDKGEQKCAEIKEDYAPEKVEKEADKAKGDAKKEAKKEAKKHADKAKYGLEDDEKRLDDGTIVLVGDDLGMYAKAEKNICPIQKVSRKKLPEVILFH